MAQKAHVPRFGNWDGDDDIPYTQYFDNARMGKADEFDHAAPVYVRPAKNILDSDAPKNKDGSHHGTLPHLDSESQKPVSSSPQDHKRRSSKVGSRSERGLAPIKSGNRHGISSPSTDKRNLAEGTCVFAPNTSSRSKGRHGSQGSDMQDKSSSVSKFAKWEETDPASADVYAHISNKVMEEKQASSSKVQVISHDLISTNCEQDARDKSVGCWCFPWNSK